MATAIKNTKQPPEQTISTLKIIKDKKGFMIEVCSDEFDLECLFRENEEKVKKIMLKQLTNKFNTAPDTFIFSLNWIKENHPLVYNFLKASKKGDIQYNLQYLHYDLRDKNSVKKLAEYYKAFSDETLKILVEIYGDTFRFYNDITTENVIEQYNKGNMFLEISVDINEIYNYYQQIYH